MIKTSYTREEMEKALANNKEEAEKRAIELYDEMFEKLKNEFSDLPTVVTLQALGVLTLQAIKTECFQLKVFMLHNRINTKKINDNTIKDLTDKYLYYVKMGMSTGEIYFKKLMNKING